MEEFKRYYRILLHVENHRSLCGSKTRQISRTRKQIKTSFHSQLVRFRLFNLHRNSFDSFSNKPHQCLLPNRPQTETKPCESCGSMCNYQRMKSRVLFFSDIVIIAMVSMECHSTEYQTLCGMLELL